MVAAVTPRLLDRRSTSLQLNASHDNYLMEYTVRTARIDDAEAFIPLLSSLGYPSSLSSLKTRISSILTNPDAVLLVAVSTSSDEAVGLISLHFIPQLGIEGDVARIGFFVVDEKHHGAGIGKMLELQAERVSRDRGCNRMEVHCHARRVSAHRFYMQRGYSESPKYFAKLFGEKPDAEKAWEAAETKNG